MKLVDKWYDYWDREGEKEDVTQEEVSAPQTEFNNLDDELTNRACDVAVGSEPVAAPPNAVSLVALRLTSEKRGDDDLVECALNEDDRYDTKHSSFAVPTFQEPKELEEADKTDDSECMNTSSHPSAEPGAA